jgi:hypothetical protein
VKTRPSSLAGAAALEDGQQRVGAGHRRVHGAGVGVLAGAGDGDRAQRAGPALVEPPRVGLELGQDGGQPGRRPAVIGDPPPADPRLAVADHDAEAVAAAEPGGALADAGQDWLSEQGDAAPDAVVVAGERDLQPGRLARRHRPLGGGGVDGGDQPRRQLGAGHRQSVGEVDRARDVDVTCHRAA